MFPKDEFMKPFIVKCDFANEKVALRIYSNPSATLFHTHDFDEIAFILKGSAVHQTGGRSYPIMRGDVFVIHGNQIHKISKKTKNFTIANIIYEPNFFDEIKKKFKDIPGFSALFLYEPVFRNMQKFNAFFHLSSQQLQNIETLFTELGNEQVERETSFMPIIESIFIQIVANLCRYYRKTNNVDTKGMLKISLAIDYIESHFEEKITTAQLSNVSQMSNTTFRRAFKKMTGSTSIDYLIHYRIEKAAEMMRKRPAISVIQVCLSSGFENTGHFSKKFKKIIGVTPIQYLKKLRSVMSSL